MSKYYTNVKLYKNKFLVKAIEDGKRVSYKMPCKPYLFLPAKSKDKVTEFHTLNGNPVEIIDFDSSWDQHEFVSKYEDIEDFKFYGMTQSLYVWIHDNFKGELKYNFDDIHITTLDIEVDSENGFGNTETADKEVIAITMRSRDKNMVFGCKEFINKDPENTTYVHCEDEVDLLKRFLTTWNDKWWAPDIVTGWNVQGYDIPYLVRRIERVVSPSAVNMLSPWGMVDSHTYSGMFNKKQEEFELVGISVLDYMQLYKKFSYTPQESHRLDHIAFVECKEKKLDYSKYGTLAELYKQDFQTFIEYNIHDCWLVDKLEEKRGFLKLVMAIAYDSKVNYSDAFTTVRLWDVIIHNYLLDQKIVIPQSKHGLNTGEAIEGAYVKEPIVGLHDWIVNFDLNSLYPHLIMQYNISPETLVGSVSGVNVDSVLNMGINTEVLSKNNIAVAASGFAFRKDKHGFLPELMKKIYDGRLIWKKRMIEAQKRLENDKENRDIINEVGIAKTMQHALKIVLNGGYGALCNVSFRWFDKRLGESITLSGQVAIQWVENRMNKWLNEQLKTEGIDYVVAGDTDSMYLRLGTYVDIFGPKGTSKIVDWLDKQCNEVFQPLLDRWFKELADYTNAYGQMMQMKRETIADKGIWTGKKHYVLNAWDIEGVRHKEPEIKITGISSVRSSTPTIARKNIKESIKIILNKTQPDLHKFIEDFKKEYNTLPIEDIAFPRSCNNLAKNYNSKTIFGKKCDIGPKSGLIYNWWLKENNLGNKYEPIREGDKIKFVYLKMPNLLRQKVVGFVNVPPAELDLTNITDFDIMFEKSYLKPIRDILNVIGWQTEERNTLEKFFE